MRLLETAQAAMVPRSRRRCSPIRAVAYTTAAAMVAEVERLLRASNRAGLQGLNVVVYGIGPVGVCSAVLARRRRRPGGRSFRTTARCGRAAWPRLCQARFGAMDPGPLCERLGAERSMLGDCHVLAVVRQSVGCGCSVATSWPRRASCWWRPT